MRVVALLPRLTPAATPPEPVVACSRRAIGRPSSHNWETNVTPDKANILATELLWACAVHSEHCRNPHEPVPIEAIATVESWFAKSVSDASIDSRIAAALWADRFRLKEEEVKFQAENSQDEAYPGYSRACKCTMMIKQCGHYIRYCDTPTWPFLTGFFTRYATKVIAAINLHDPEIHAGPLAFICKF